MSVQFGPGGLLGGCLCLALVVFSGSAAAIDKEDVARQIAERFAVQVLDVKPGKVDSQEAWLVTVMKHGGNRNDAFQVSRLAVDRDSGELLPAFRHRTSGYDLPERQVIEDPGDLRPDAMRSGAWR